MSRTHSSTQQLWMNKWKKMNEAAPLSLRPSCPLYCPHTDRSPTKPQFLKQALHFPTSVPLLTPFLLPGMSSPPNILVKTHILLPSWSFPWLSPVWAWSDCIFPWITLAQSGYPGLLFRQSPASHCVTLSKPLPLIWASVSNLYRCIQWLFQHCHLWPDFFGVQGGQDTKEPQVGLLTLESMCPAPSPENQFITYYKLIELLTKQINKYLLNTIIVKGLSHIPSLGFYCRRS